MKKLCILFIALVSKSSIGAEALNWSERIAAIPIFAEPLVFAGPEAPDETESEALHQRLLPIRSALENPPMLTLRATNAQTVSTTYRRAPADYSALEGFIREYPESGWTPCLRAYLGRHYRGQGRYSLALAHWEKAWNSTKTRTGDAKRVADFALVQWTSLLASLGRVETLAQIFAETEGRPLDGGYLQQMFDAAREGYHAMLARPGYSFQCGTYAVHEVARALRRTNFLIAAGGESPAVKLLRVPSPAGGFSLKALCDFADEHDLSLTAVRRGARSDLIPVPSVIHWKHNHYAAIVAEHAELYRVVDQTFGEPKWLASEAINAEASGYFMVASERVPPGWNSPTQEELGRVIGKHSGNSIKDENDQHDCETPGSNGVECETNCTGMVRWWVSEPYITLWLEDEPLGYQPSRGPRVAFHLSFKSRNTRPPGQFNFNFGAGWECSWMSTIGSDNFMVTVDGNQTNVTYDAVIYLPGGGVQRYSATNEPIDSAGLNYFSRTRLVPLVSGVTLMGWERRFPDGAKDVYQSSGPGGGIYDQNIMMTVRYDSLGNFTGFQYDQIGRLTNVVDVDYRSTTFTYNAFNNVTSVTDPFGRTATLTYHFQDGQRYLTNIVDPVGLISRMRLDAIEGKVVHLQTHTAHTSFAYGGTATGNYLGETPVARSLLVTENSLQGDPFGDRPHLYLYRDDTPDVPDSHPDAPISTPIGTIENTNLRYRNTFYWGPRQYGALTNGNPLTFTSFDYRKGRMRHWLNLAATTPLHVGSTLSFERGPSADTGGVGEGRKTWYDYPNKENNDPSYEGTSGLPGVLAWVDQGQIYYKWFRRNALGRPTNVVETWSETAGAPQLLRTNVFRYAADGIDLLEWTGPNGERLAGIEYNDRHQVTRHTNALNEVTSLTYNGLFQIERIDFPSGVSREFTYFSTGSFPNWLFKIQDLPMGGDHVFNYTNGVISQWSDPRGRTLHLGWDKLQRIVSVKFPDNTYVSNLFFGLDVVGTRDRLGRWTRFKYWPTRELNIVTNALGATGGITTLDWCACGALEKVTDALARETHFLYDNAGRLMRFWDDEVTVNVGMDLFNRLTSMSKGLTAPILNRTFSYTLHGLPARAMTDTNQSYAVKYDNRDRPVWFTNALGLAFTNTYDDLNRLVARRWPNNTSETFTHSANGLVGNTDRLGFTTRLFRDFANRTLWITNASTNTLKFVYNPAGDLGSFTDGKNQTTTWTYDVHGNLRTNAIAGTDVLRLTYDAGDRVINRWMPATSNTVYAYNALDSITNLSYRAGATQTVSFAYDALQRVTSMADALGTHIFDWSQRGNLLAENGPWEKDKLTSSYFNDLRKTLSLQQSNAPSWALTNGYDASHRLTNIVSPSGMYAYQYFPGVGAGGFDSDLVQKVTLPNGSWITNAYDPVLADQAFTELRDSDNILRNRHSYMYDDGSQRTNASFTTDDAWVSEYDPLGQLRSAQPKYAGGVTYPHEKTDWTYDGADNVASRTRGGLTYTFNTDSRNRLTSITRTGTITIAGFATNNPASATVNGQPAIFYGTNFAAGGVALNNGANTFTAIAEDIYGRKATNTMAANYPATITFAYDSNGNMTSDGTHTFKYDAENRLTNIVVTGQWQSYFLYDGLGRKRIRREYTWTNSAWTLSGEVRYIYDGFLALQERNQNNVPRTTYTRGIDLSGSFDGAGGVGGLLGMTRHAQTINYTHYFYHSDALGNITVLQDTNEVIQDKYLYDPWGNAFSMSGPLTNISRMRMSGKEWHVQSGLIDFGARFYNPTWQRWMNEDPIGIAGGLNLYAYVGNDPFNSIDPWGEEILPYNDRPDRQCASECEEELRRCAEENTFLSGAIGGATAAGAQIYNKTGQKPRKGLAGGGRSKGASSRTRLKYRNEFTKNVGRLPVGVAAGIGVAVGDIIGNVICYANYGDCLSKCPRAPREPAGPLNICQNAPPVLTISR